MTRQGPFVPATDEPRRKVAAREPVGPMTRR
jgi:hypothetical protein